MASDPSHKREGGLIPPLASLKKMIPLRVLFEMEFWVIRLNRVVSNCIKIPSKLKRMTLYGPIRLFFGPL